MSKGYKKYMKKEAQNENPFIKIFVLSFFGMLLIFTLLIKSFTPMVDTSIGDYKEQTELSETDEEKKIVDNRLEMIQNEDQGKSFSDLMANATDIDNTNKDEKSNVKSIVNDVPDQKTKDVQPPTAEPIYKVFIGSYTSAEQAKIEKDIIIESGNGLNPIVKCIGPNNYTLQVGIFKNKQSAETMMNTVQQNHLPCRIVQDY